MRSPGARLLVVTSAGLMVAGSISLGAVGASAAPVAVSSSIAAPRYNTEAGAINPLAVAPVTSARLAANSATAVRVGGLTDNAGGALVQVSVDLTQASAVSVGPTSKGPFVPVISASRAGTWGGTAIVATTGTIYVRSTSAAAARVSTLAWIAEADEDVPLGAGAVGIAIPVTRLETAKGFGAKWLTTARDIQMTGLGGIPSRGASTILASVSLRPTSGTASLSHTFNGATTTSLTATSAEPLTSLLALPVDSRGVVRLKTSSAAQVTITPVGWVSRGRYDRAPVSNGAVQPVLAQTLVTGRLPAKATLAPKAVPAQPGAVTLVSIQASGSGSVSVGGAKLPVATGAVTGLVPAITKATRPVLTTSGGVTGGVTSVGWIDDMSYTEFVRPTLTIAGAPSMAVDLKGDGEFILSGRATDASGIYLVRVEVPDGGQGWAVADVDPFTGAWSLPYAPPGGQHEILVTAYDREGNDSEATIIVDVTAADPNEMLTAPNVVALTNSQRESIGTLSETQITFSSTTSPVRPGDIVSIRPGGKVPYGALLHVVAVSPNPAGGWTVVTRRAAPEEALIQGNFGVTDDLLAGLTGLDRKAQGAKRPRDFTIEPEFVVPYNISAQAQETWKSEDKVLTGSGKITATTGGAFRFRLKVLVQTCFFVPCGGQVETFNIRLENTTTVDVELHSTFGKEKSAKKEWALTPAPINTGVIMIGPIPIHTSLQPKGYVDIKASLDVTAYAQKQMNFELIYTHAGGWQQPVLDINQPINWRLDLDFEGEAEAGVKFIEALKIGGFAGPTVNLKAGLLGVEGHASFTIGSAFPDPSCNVEISFYSKLGLGVGLILGDKPDAWSAEIYPIEIPITWYTWPEEDLCPDQGVPWMFSLIPDLAGGGVTARDVSMRGDPTAVATIDGTSFGGGLFSTGNARGITREDFRDQGFTALGSYDLNRLFDTKTTDASTTQFTVIPEGRELRIPFRFMSDEYAAEDPKERGRDVVAILVNGINCAKTRDGEPVNSRTAAVDPEADPEAELPYAGISREYICRVPVEPLRPIPVQIVVADVGEDRVDTALYIPWEGINSR